MDRKSCLSIAALCCASAAFAAGPDITHQEIQDTISYGQVGGVYAYSWGSYTCNIGNASLSWVNGGTPALAMNAYRLHGGVLRQVGYGFAKHACCVANGSGCGTCSAGGTGLRPGCRDVYGASFNGGQSRLGPRSGINPYEGTFTVIPSFSGSIISRRVQVKQADMNAVTYPNAQWFAEGVYVCAEEEPFEQLNNATYRRMSVANTGGTPTYNWTVSPTVSQTGRPAIYAWKDHGLGANTPDPSVLIVSADIPDEGRFYAAGKVTQISTNPPQWRYDYAVFNLNSHRGAGSLSVPVHPTLSVSSPLFTDVDYHSGEPWSMTDWTQTTASNQVRWETQTFAANQNANALRWGTMFNYSFVSDAAPATNSRALTLGLFRPGSASSVGSIDFTGLKTPGLPSCPADTDDGSSTGVRDGGIGIEDLLFYLAVYGEGDARADLDDGSNTGSPDGGTGIEDLLYYLDRYDSGC